MNLIRTKTKKWNDSVIWGTEKISERSVKVRQKLTTG